MLYQGFFFQAQYKSLFNKQYFLAAELVTEINFLKQTSFLFHISISESLLSFQNSNQYIHKPFSHLGNGQSRRNISYHGFSRPIFTRSLPFCRQFDSLYICIHFYHYKYLSLCITLMYKLTYIRYLYTRVRALHSRLLGVIFTMWNMQCNIGVN